VLDNYVIILQHICSSRASRCFNWWWNRLSTYIILWQIFSFLCCKIYLPIDVASFFSLQFQTSSCTCLQNPSMWMPILAILNQIQHCLLMVQPRATIFNTDKYFNTTVTRNCMSCMDYTWPLMHKIKTKTKKRKFVECLQLSDSIKPNGPEKIKR